jgi:hypothetical protein
MRTPAFTFYSRLLKPDKNTGWAGKIPVEAAACSDGTPALL